MIKLIYAIRRRSDFSLEGFHDRWLIHGRLVTKLASAIRASDYFQSHTIDAAVNKQLAAVRRITAPPFDGVAEIWWQSLDNLMAGAASREGQAAYAQLLEDEKQFIDLANSSIFVTEEHTIFGNRSRN
jgi:hypothetical protein